MTYVNPESCKTEHDVGALFAGTVELMMKAPWKNTGLKTTCSGSPDVELACMSAYQPNELLSDGDTHCASPFQQTLFAVPSMLPGEVDAAVNVWTCRFVLRNT